MSANELSLGKQAIARYTGGLEHFRGKVVAYCPVPSVLIENPETGEQVWWRADQTDIAEEQGA